MSRIPSVRGSDLPNASNIAITLQRMVDFLTGHSIVPKTGNKASVKKKFQ
jgi:hypothetical protein